MVSLYTIFITFARLKCNFLSFIFELYEAPFLKIFSLSLDNLHTLWYNHPVAESYFGVAECSEADSAYG